MSIAKIEDHNGRPAIVIDGKPYPPMAFTAYFEDPKYIREVGESGIRIFDVMCNTDWLRPGGEAIDDDGQPCIEPPGFEAFAEQAKLILEAVPDGYILVRLGMHPPADWVESHPDDIVRYDDGSTKTALIVSEVHGDTLPGAYSLCSDAWREDGTKALMEFCDKVDASSFGDRVIGYFLTAGGTSEWYYVNPLMDGERVADFSPAFRREFTRFLKEKYQTETALREAWGDPQASFENPAIPDLDSRLFSYVDGRIIDAVRMHEALSRTLHYDGELNPVHEANIGVFLNMNHYVQVADFFEAWSTGTANTVVHFARALKARYPGKLTGAFYGAYGCTHYFNNGTSATLRVLNSGVVDFLASPGDYLNRQPGGSVPQREMSDSFSLRNMVFFSEDDSRTHLDELLYRDAMRCYTMEDSVNLLKRDFARNLCDGTYGWWFDQHHGGGRFKNPEFLELFRRQQQVADYAFGQNRTKNSEIAAIYDQDSTHLVSQGTSDLLLELFRGSELGRIGAPVDHYFHDDMEKDTMPDYKLYIMVNVFCLTDEERRAIHRKAAKNGAVILWLYAPGFINPTGTPRLDNANIERTIGMKVTRVDDTIFPRFKLIKADHPALRYGDRDRVYGYIDRDIHDNIWGGYCVPLSFMNPGFVIDDPEAEVLGHYCMDGQPALALKKQPEGWTSVYCAPQIMRAELLASLAEYAGCHIYNYEEDCIYANRSFVTVHASYSGEHTLYFPCDTSPYEVYEKRFYGHNVRKLTLQLHLGETKMFAFEQIPD